MADRLTQLQDCFDQLATQFYASIRYISTHHSTSALDSQPIPSSHSTQNNTAQSNIIINNNDTMDHQPNPTQSTQSQEQPTTAQQSQPSQDPLLEVDTALFPEQRPDTPNTFASAQRELAHDLILKTQQIEYIVSVLPGVQNSKEKQEQKIKDLDENLRAAFEERKMAEGLREEWLRRVDGVIGGVVR